MSRSGHRAPSQRQLRVGEELRHALARTLERAPLRDPDMAGVTVTVTEVQVSPDLRNAAVYVVPLGGDREGGEGARAVGALRRARSFLRHQVAGSVHLKYVPALDFRLDETFDTAARINDILHDPRVVRDLAPHAEVDGDGGPNGEPQDHGP